MASGRSGSEWIMAIWTGPRVVRLFSGHPCRVDAGGTQSLERSFDGSISGVGEVGATFGGLDCGNETTDVSPRVVDGALLGEAHPVLDLGEGLLDRVEVG